MIAVKYSTYFEVLDILRTNIHLNYDNIRIWTILIVN